MTVALSLKGGRGFALGLWLRAAAIGALFFATIEAAVHQRYATALVILAVAVVVGLDLARSAQATDRMLAQFIDILMMEGDERPLAAAGAGRLAGAIGRALDRLSGARAQRQQRLDFAEALADNVVAALLAVDETGQIVRANRAARLMLGEAAGPLDRLPALAGPAAAALQDLAPGRRGIVRLADGRSLLASVSRFAAPGSAPLRLVALQSLSGDLDLVVLKSWHDLVRVLAHEMMNSLTPICSLSDSLASRLRSAPQDGVAAVSPSEVAQAVEAIARRSAGLMNFVERYRRLADLPPAARREVALGRFIDGLDQLMAPLMRSAGVDYASAVEPPALTVQADADLLEQATINLLKNALDAVSGQADAMVRLSCRLDADQLVIAVEDNGPGLPADDAEAAFVPFFTTKAGGSGVGLTLSRQIALAHGGRLEHQRRSPRGASFRLLLPR